MGAVAKRMKPWAAKIVPGKQFPIDEALALVKQFATAKFDESVDVAVNLGIDPTKSDQQVRGSTVLPHGTGKVVRVAVFTSGKNADAARVGADPQGAGPRKGQRHAEHGQGGAHQPGAARGDREDEDAGPDGGRPRCGRADDRGQRPQHGRRRGGGVTW